jgi:hypothetical protein
MEREVEFVHSTTRQVNEVRPALPASAEWTSELKPFMRSSLLVLARLDSKPSMKSELSSRNIRRLLASCSMQV